MHRLLITAFLLAAPPALVLAADTPASSPDALYLLSAQAAPAEDGRLLTMTLRETQRAADFSIVDVEFVAGGPASSLFLVRGLCGLMRARGQKLAVAEQVAERPVQFRITFPKSAQVEDPKGLPRMVLSEADCARFPSRGE